MKKTPKILMLVGSLMLLLLFVTPLWRITLEAPQYPGGITMYIWIDKITGDTPYTLQNINILNHYVGMQYIEPDSIPELKYFPFIIVGMTILGVLFSFIGNRKLVLVWVLTMVALGVLGLYDFYLWEYDYGHNLDPTAPIKVPGMAYQPPVFGSKMLLNFNAISYPYWGGMFLGISMILAAVSFFISGKKIEKRTKQKLVAGMKMLLTISIGLLMLASCKPKPEPITYGHDGCAFCKMTIMDPRYATELVTDKGKVYKFDAIECMINYEKENSQTTFALKLVSTFDKKELKPADESYYLHSEELPSPMGMYLTGFSDEKIVKSFAQKHGGQVYSWEGLNNNYNQLPAIKPMTSN